ncbi:FAD-dependent oxidoreductase [Anaerolineae bacterium CFX9]|nr:FAD-dependent oxidoreductase [Anaerolineae bacterium CFX9]
MNEYYDTIVIGAGHAGLATSYCLTQKRRSHLVLEKHAVGEAWRSAKWDSFTLVSPNWTLRLPGFHYQGDDPDGFLKREEVVCYLEDYVRAAGLPVRTGVHVLSVEQHENRFLVRTTSDIFEADHVVVATGTFQKPRIPALAGQISPDIQQLHTSQYRNPHQLPDGAVLVVGSGQSGCQIAYELSESGRAVYLCAGSAGSLPRRYRGRDVFVWAEMLGMLDQPVSKLPSPAARFAANPQLTGRNGGHDLNLHHLAKRGVKLLGRLHGGAGSVLSIAPDLMTTLKQMDEMSAEFRQAVDDLIAESRLDTPPDDFVALDDGYGSEIITELDLHTAGITTIIWATGYTYDYRWLPFSIFDDTGYPIQKEGATAVPGLYFVGLHWQRVAKSDLFAGVGEEAVRVVDQIVSNDIKQIAR